MYNLELKNRFLNNYPEDSAKTYRDSLMQISQGEEFFGKDIFNMSYEEIDESFKLIRAKSLAGVWRIVSPIKQYANWANENGYVSSKIDVLQLFRDEDLKKYVWKNAEENRYIYREELYSICERLINDIDKAILVLSFEGIGGRKYFEARNLKYSDIDFQTGKVQLTNIDGEMREITITHKESLDIIKSAQSQRTYIPCNGYKTGGSGMYQYDILVTDYVIRRTIRPKDFEKIKLLDLDSEELMTSHNYLSGKTNRIFKGVKDKKTGRLIDEPHISDCQFLNLNTIFKSGYFDFCMSMEKEKGKLDINDYKHACERYGINLNMAYSYKKQYESWKNDKK